MPRAEDFDFDGGRVFRVNFHGGSMFSLVEAGTERRAVEIARAHREAGRIWKGRPLPKEVRDDVYTAVPATERDQEWARECGGRVLIDMPVKPAQNGAQRAKPLAGTQTPQNANGAVRPLRQVA